MRQNRPQNLGSRGESDALNHLQGKGYSLIERNYQTRWGELDLVVQAPDGTVVFVEVKARVESKYGSPLEQIDPGKLGRLRRAIDYYLNERRWQEKRVRLDAVGVEYAFEGDLEDRPLVKVRLEHVVDVTGW